MGKREPVTIEPCGCKYDSTGWRELCQTCAEFARQARESTELGSLKQLIEYYERNPSADNLRHVVERIRKLGNLVTQHEWLVQWITSNKHKLIGAGA